MSTTRFLPPGNTLHSDAVQLDDAQQAVCDLLDTDSAVVIGAPGTGKTTTLIEVFAERVLHRGWNPDEVLALTTSRVSATRLRDRVALRLEKATNGPLARTINSLAFEILTHVAQRSGAQPPTLLTGGDQDSDISALLAGQLADSIDLGWPDHLGPDVRRLRGFRTELRELMMRATEYGVTPEQLRALADEHDRPEWAAASSFIDSYLEVVTSSRINQLDSAELVQFALAALVGDDYGERVEKLKLVLIDDVQELTTSGIALARVLASRGIAVIAFGDPDVAANAFRGGEPNILGRLSQALEIPDLATMFLSTAHRQSPQLREFTRSVTERIGTAGIVGHRKASTARKDDERLAVVRIEADTPAREYAAIARSLREAHVRENVPWNEIVIVTRSGGQIPAISRALALADVPTRTTAGGRALREDRAARHILRVIDIGSGRSALTAEIASELLLGPFGGMDRLALRRLRLALRTEELAGGSRRTADELIVEALSEPGRFVTIDQGPARRAERLAEVLFETRKLAAGGATIEELLWHVWDRSSLATAWFEQSTGVGIVADEANRSLDGVLALFTAAKRFVERDPSAGADIFLERVLDAEVPEDTLSPRADSDSVLVTTPPGVVGMEFDTVVVAGVQDGIWPNLRLRGSLLYPQQLVRVVTRLNDVELDGRKEVLSDELRMFALAISRARNRVFVTAVSNEDEAASVFFALLPQDSERQKSRLSRPLSLRALTAHLRRELTAAEPSHRPGHLHAEQEDELRAASSALARLVSERVPGADPAQWHGLLPISTAEKLYRDDETVPISPSRLKSFEDSALDWFIESVSGSTTSTAMGLGTIVHWAMETAADPSVDTIWRAIEERWNELVFESPWIGQQQKRAARILADGIAEYLADFERQGNSLIAAERRFVLEFERARVSGSIDRVEQSSDGAVVITDLKTGSPITKQDEIDVHPQLGAYQLAYAEGKLDDLLGPRESHRSGGAKLLFVKGGVRGKLYREATQRTLNDDELDGFRERIRQAAIGMTAASFAGDRNVPEWGSGDTAKRKLYRVKAVSSD